jgi:hypothetical protein
MYRIRDQYQFYQFSQNYLYKSLISFATKKHHINTGLNGFREQKSTKTTTQVFHGIYTRGFRYMLTCNWNIFFISQKHTMS